MLEVEGMVILYSNERVIRHGNNYYAKVINFTDFLVMLSRKSGEYRLALSCNTDVGDDLDTSRLTLVTNPGNIFELPYLENRYQSFFYSFYIALKLRSFIKTQTESKSRLAVVSPGLNSITFVLSFMLPRSTGWYLFIRGDTRKTLDEIYRHSFRRRLMTGMIDIFQWRVKSLLRQGRGRSFVFGQALKEKFYRAYPSRTHVVSPLLSEDWISVTAPAVSSRAKDCVHPKVLYVGRLSAEKNISQLIEACENARAARYQFDLTIVGDGPLESSLRSMVERLDLEGLVSFTGRISNGPELIEIYDSHDLFCLPSKTEGTPRAIAESVARGLPVVASDVGSIRYMFSDGVVRFLQGFDADHILSALGQVFENLDEIAGLAREHRFEAKKHTLAYNVENVHQLIQKDFADLLMK